LRLFRMIIRFIFLAIPLPPPIPPPPPATNRQVRISSRI
jgi:hypothetical protein